MPYLVVQNFKKGLDSTAYELTAEAGSLVTLENAHLTRAGEIERRKRFELASTVPFPDGTFGLQDSGTSLYTFGSGDLAAAVGAMALASVTSLVYQRLQHPAVLEGAVYDATKHAMTAVPVSTSFGGVPWVAATYADGKTFVFEDGAVCSSFRNGIVLSAGTTLTIIATHAADVINDLDGFHTSQSAGVIDIWSDAGVDYQISAEVDSSAAGVVAVTKSSDSTDGTAAVGAVGSFTITRSYSGTEITSVKVNSVEIIGATVVNTTPLLTGYGEAAHATLVAAAINAYSSSPKYTARASGPTVFIYADPEQGATPNGYVVEVSTFSYVNTGSPHQTTISSGSFTLPNVFGTTCSSITVSGYGADLLLLGPVTYNTTYSAWLIAIATSIANTGSSTPSPFVADTIGTDGVLYISPSTAKSSDTPATITVTLSAGTITPNTPASATALSANPGDGQVLLAWTAASGATSYNVKRSLTNGGPYTTLSSPASSPYTDTAVANGTTYYYVVTAVNATGESASSNQVVAKPQVPIAGAPTGLTATPASGSVALAWTALAGATVYNVKRATTSGGPYTILSTTASASYSDTSVTNGTTYFYVVSGFVVGVESLNSIEAGATPSSGTTAQPFIVTLNQSLAQETSSSLSTTTRVAATGTKASAAGGSGGYTYAWEAVNNPNDIQIGYPHRDHTGFFADVTRGHSVTGTFRCVVTDSSGAVANSSNVTVKLTHT